MAIERESSTEFYGGAAAIKIAAAFAFVLFVVVGFTAFDATRKRRLERFSQVTAVGDTRYFDPAKSTATTPVPVVAWDKRQFAIASAEKVKIDDPEMRRVHVDPASGFTIYRPASEKNPDTVFIKIAVGEYLRLMPFP